MRRLFPLTFALALPLFATGCVLFGIDLPNEDGETSDSETSDSETSDSETSDGSETQSEDSFVPPARDLLPTCDVVMQDCPDGEKCVAYGTDGGNWNANKCVPVTGDQAPGEPCMWGGIGEATDDCDQTSACWQANEEGIGICRAFCTGSIDDPSCPEAHFCLISSGGEIAFCIPACDPIAQDCNDGLACFWANSNFQCIFTTQAIELGEPCGFVNDCAGGLMCINGELLPACEGQSCCASFCALELGDAQCAALPGTSCIAFFEPGRAPPAYEHVGVCMLP